MALEFGAFRDEITKYDTFRYMGKIEKIVGMTIEASGPACNIGDVCRIYSKDMTSFIRAEVVGFNKSNILLMPDRKSTRLNSSHQPQSRMPSSA